MKKAIGTFDKCLSELDIRSRRLKAQYDTSTARTKITPKRPALLKQPYNSGQSSKARCHPLKFESCEVADAIPVEPVSTPKFLANREKWSLLITNVAPFDLAQVPDASTT